MIKGAIFDVDGTLLDSMEIWEHAGERYLRSIGTVPAEGLSKILFPMTVEEGASYMKEKYQLSQSRDKVIEGVLRTVRDFYYYEAPLKEGVSEFLEEFAARKIPMVIATSSEREHIEAAFQRLGIRKYFQQIFTCSEVGAGKSKPVIYEKAREYLGTFAEETYVFEDVFYAIATAKKAGFRAVGVFDDFSRDDWEGIKKEADISLKDFKELYKFWNYAEKL